MARNSPPRPSVFCWRSADLTFSGRPGTTQMRPGIHGTLPAPSCPFSTTSGRAPKPRQTVNKTGWGRHPVCSQRRRGPYGERDLILALESSSPGRGRWGSSLVWGEGLSLEAWGQLEQRPRGSDLAVGSEELEWSPRGSGILSANGRKGEFPEGGTSFLPWVTHPLPPLPFPGLTSHIKPPVSPASSQARKANCESSLRLPLTEF